MYLSHLFLEIPAFPSFHLRRDILHRKLSRDAEAQIVLLEAGGGFGKTTLLAEYLTTNQSPVIWYPLEYLPHTGFISFVLNLLRAVEVIDPEIQTHFSAYLNQLLKSGEQELIENRLTEWLLPALLQQIERWQKPTSLVFENYHVLDNPKIDDFLFQLCELAPAALRIFVTTRVKIAWRWRQEWEASGRLVAIDQQQFRLSQAEAQLLALNIDRSIDATTALELHRATDGWPLLFVLACRQHSLYSTLHKTIRTSPLNRSIQEQANRYLEGLLAVESPEHQQFLLQTSILDDLTPARCNLLLQQHTGWQMLTALGNTIFLRQQPTENDLHFRHSHAIIQTFLRAQLTLRFAPAKIEHLYNQLGQMYEVEESWESALSCYVKACNQDAAGALLEDNLFFLLDTGQFRRLEDRLQLLPEQWLHQSPAIMLCQGVLFVYQENPQAVSLLQRVIECSQSPADRPRRMLALAELIHFHHVQNNYSPGFDWEQSLQDDLLPPRLQAHILYRRAMALVGIDRFADALTAIEEALRLRQRLNTPADELVVNGLMRMKAITLGYLGCVQTAVQVLIEACARVKSLPNHQFHLAWTLNNLSAGYRLLGEFEAAHRVLNESGAILETYRPVLGNHRLFVFWEMNLAHLHCDTHDDEWIAAWLKRRLSVDQRNYKSLYQEALFDYYLSQPHLYATGLELAQKVWQREWQIESPNVVSKIAGTLGLAYLVNGDAQNALQMLQQGLDVWQRHAPNTIGSNQIYAMLYLSAAQFQLGQQAQGLSTLLQGLGWMHEHGFYNLEVWVPQVMARLCYLALTHHIEADYVESLVVKRFRNRYNEPFYKLLLHEDPQIRQRAERLIRQLDHPNWQQAYDLLQSCKEISTQQRLLTWLTEGWLTPFGLLFLRQLFSWRELETFLLWIHPTMQAESETIARAMLLSTDTVKSYLKSVKQILRTHFSLAVDGRGAQMPAFDWAIKQAVVDARR